MRPLGVLKSDRDLAHDIKAGPEPASRRREDPGTGVSLMTKILKRRSRAARTWISAAGGIAALALVLAACRGTSRGQHAAPAASSSGGTSVALASSKLGKILVDDKGQTLYLFQADKG